MDLIKKTLNSQGIPQLSHFILKVVSFLRTNDVTTVCPILGKKDHPLAKSKASLSAVDRIFARPSSQFAFEIHRSFSTPLSRRVKDGLGQNLFVPSRLSLQATVEKAWTSKLQH